jgi:predicted permease
MTQIPNRPVAISLRLYRVLAAAFPHEFKNVYGEELVQVTEDAIEPIWKRHGLLGLARLLTDIAIRVPIEHLHELWQDIRYGLRMLARSPGFTSVALISLSLGICVATSAFSELNGFALRDVPVVSKPGQLVMLQAPTSYPVYKRYRERSDLFSSTLAYIAPVPFGVSLDGRTERIWGHLVTPSYFATLGVRPVLGRSFENDPEQPGQAPTLVVSYRFWQAHLGSDPLAIGKTLHINGRACTVIGVGPPEFQGASPMVYGADLWMPAWVEPKAAPELAGAALEQRDHLKFQVLGRLQPRVTTERAEAELDTVARRLEQDFGEEDKSKKGRRLRLVPGGKLVPIRKQDLPFLTSFFTVLGGMVLLIACSNVANMLLARAADRRREIAVRLAIGASRARLIRQLMTESVIVAAAAGVLGFVASMWVMRLASQIKLPSPMPITLNLEPDGRVLLFTIGLTLFTGLAFGLAPAFQATRTDLTPALKEGGNVLLRRYRRLSLRNLLMVSQVAGSLTLLLITGFLALGFQRTMGNGVGFDARNLYLISLDPIRDGYSGEQAAAFLPKLLDRVKLLPSITAASLADTTPMAMMGKPWAPFSTEGANAGDSRVIHGAVKYLVGRDYFDTVGVPILRGRGFRKADEGDEARAIVVSERLAQESWKGEDPLGRRIELIGYEDVPQFNPLRSGGLADRRPGMSTKGRQTLEIVGVAKNERDGVNMVASQAHPVIYAPLRAADFGQPSLQGITLIVRAAPGADAIGALRREVSAMDSKVTPYNARSMTEQIDQMMYPIRASIWTYGCVGVFGLILASVGLAGMTAYSVAQRGREIGIRMALGAQSADVLGLVMKEGAVLVSVGTVLGLAGAWAGTRLLASLLSEVARATGKSVSDPMLLVCAPLLLAGLALVACFVPARRSLRVDPVIALRQE